MGTVSMIIDVVLIIIAIFGLSYWVGYHDVYIDKIPAPCTNTTVAPGTSCSLSQDSAGHLALSWGGYVICIGAIIAALTALYSESRNGGGYSVGGVPD